MVSIVITATASKRFENAHEDFPLLKHLMENYYGKNILLCIRVLFLNGF